MPTYKPIDGEMVSAEWLEVLTDMRGDGVDFNVNEGHRTFARQAQLFRQNMIAPGRPKPGRPLTAAPTPWAPHIRTGRIDHAIDFNGAAGVLAWLRKHGLRGQLTVPGESWHVEVPAGDLRIYAARHGDPVLRKGVINRDGTKAAQRMLRALGYSVAITGRYDLATRRAVRRFQEKQRLTVDGVVGSQVWGALREALAEH